MLKIRLALAEICRVTGASNPDVALRCFIERCEPGINHYWLPFYHFRCFFTFELSAQTIIDYRRGNSALRHYRPPIIMSPDEVERFIGVDNLPRLIRMIGDNDNSIIADHLQYCLSEKEFNIIDIGTLYSILEQNQIKTMFIPEKIASAAKSCIGLNVAHIVASVLSDQ